MPSFSIANINPGTVRAEFMKSVLDLVCAPRPADVRFDQFYSQLSGPYLDTERNNCVEWFRQQTDSEYLLFIDSDIAFRPEDCWELIRRADAGKHLLAGGVYFNALRPGGLSPVVYMWQHDDSLGQRNLLPVPWEAVKAHGELTEGVVPVDAFGTGFMAIHRSLINQMREAYSPPTPYFAELAIDGIHMGEDLTFCVRAKALDVDPVVFPAIVVDHYKTCVIRPEPSQLIAEARVLEEVSPS